MASVVEQRGKRVRHPGCQPARQAGSQEPVDDRPRAPCTSRGAAQLQAGLVQPRQAQRLLSRRRRARHIATENSEPPQSSRSGRRTRTALALSCRSMEEFVREAARPARPMVADITRDELVEIVRRLQTATPESDYYLRLLERSSAAPPTPSSCTRGRAGSWLRSGWTWPWPASRSYDRGRLWTESRSSGGRARLPWNTSVRPSKQGPRRTIARSP